MDLMNASVNCEIMEVNFVKYVSIYNPTLIQVKDLYRMMIKLVFILCMATNSS